MRKASATNCSSCTAAIDQPTTAREKRSRTAATYNHPCWVARYVTSVTHLQLAA